MKTKHKTLSLAFAAIILLTGIFAFSPQDKKTETIMIRATQLATLGKNKSMMRVYKGKIEIEKITIEKWDIENDELNYDNIISTVQKYEQMGYEIVSHSESAYGTYGFVNTFILTKKWSVTAALKKIRKICVLTFCPGKFYCIIQLKPFLHFCLQ